MKSYILILAAVGLLVAGCATPRVDAPRSATLLGGRPADSRIPIRAFTLESIDQPFETKSEGNFFGGEQRGILFPKQAREYLATDLRDYVSASFRVDSSADAVLKLKLEQAQSYFSMYRNPMFLIPFVGMVTSIADGFQQVPVTFIVEVKADVTGAGTPLPEVDAFLRSTKLITGWSGTLEKHREIYREQIDGVRKELFDRLDAQLLTLWHDGRLNGQAGRSAASDAATLASELAKLDTALADGKITKEEHAKLVEALKLKFVPAPAVHSAPATPESK